MGFDPSDHEPKFAVIAAADSGANELVALVTGKKIRVLSVTLVSTGTVNAYFTSATTAIFGNATTKLALVANTVLPLNEPVFGLMETVAGEALGINLSGAVGVAGGLTYIELG